MKRDTASEKFRRISLSFIRSKRPYRMVTEPQRDIFLEVSRYPRIL